MALPFGNARYEIEHQSHSAADRLADTLMAMPRLLSLAEVLSFRTRLFLLFAVLLSVAGASPTIVIDPGASRTERFAARELQRYIYEQTDALLSITEHAGSTEGDALIVVSRVHGWASGRERRAEKPQSYHLQSVESQGHRQLWIVGEDDIGVLYGVYRFAETLGIRFYLDQEVVPKRSGGFHIPVIDEDRSPLFSVRGIQPFHDFAEGPDWWNQDDYLAIVGQLPKLGMNFIGLHTYPESGTGPEPTVWIGRREDELPNGKVAFAYPASYQTTERSEKYWWSYAPLPTREFLGGAAQLYDRDDYGADVMRGKGFKQQSATDSVDVFNQTGEMLRAAFAEAHELGVLTCVGTETPLTLPERVRLRAGLSEPDLKSPNWAKPFYTAIFERIQRMYPVDYYWLWTTESWTWEGNKPADFAATGNDIKSALAALTDLHSPITLATCGWVLGPQHDRAALDKILPPSSPMSAINRTDGHDAIDRQFLNLSPRPRWAIPWLENDPFLTSPQLWAGRMLFDGADARRLGQTGLIGIHWRTGTTEPTLAALALSTWDQSYTPASFDTTPLRPMTASGAIGGHSVPAKIETGSVPSASARVGASGYEVLIPNGDYTVTLGFADLEHVAAGQRVFGVKLQGAVVADHLDLAAAGKTTQSLQLENVKVSDSHLLIDFIREHGEPEIASIEIVGRTDVNHTDYRRLINCGGDKIGEYEADYLGGAARPDDRRTMPTANFYRDFATANFGSEVADEVGAIFAAEDGRNLPEPCNWIDGPGDIVRNPKAWNDVAPAYAFVEKLEAIRAHVIGASNRERFDYWLNQFRALCLIGELGCGAGALDQAVEKLKAISNADEARRFAEEIALPIRVHMARLWEELITTEIAGARTMGELGTIANLEQRSRIHQHLLDKQDEVLEKALGHVLPPAVEPSATYLGSPKIIVTTVRRFAPANEAISLRVLLVGKNETKTGMLYWRRLGEKKFHRVALHHCARALLESSLPVLDENRPGIEYHIESTIDGQPRRWPVDSAEEQSVVLY